MKRQLLKLCLVLVGMSITSAFAAPPDSVGSPPQDVRIIEQPIDINVLNEPTVSIGNDFNNPVPTNDAFSRTPFHVYFSLNIPSGSPNNNPGSTIYTVPVGQRAVIENVSIVAFLAEGQYPAVGINTSLNSVVVEHIVGPKYPTAPLSLTEPSQHFNFSESLRLYADAQSDIVIRFLRNGLNFSDLGRFSIAISGYLVPMGSPSLSP